MGKTTLISWRVPPALIARRDGLLQRLIGVAVLVALAGCPSRQGWGGFITSVHAGIADVRTTCSETLRAHGGAPTAFRSDSPGFKYRDVYARVEVEGAGDHVTRLRVFTTGRWTIARDLMQEIIRDQAAAGRESDPIAYPKDGP